MLALCTKNTLADSALHALRAFRQSVGLSGGRFFLACVARFAGDAGLAKPVPR